METALVAQCAKVSTPVQEMWSSIPDLGRSRALRVPNPHASTAEPVLWSGEPQLLSSRATAAKAPHALRSLAIRNRKGAAARRSPSTATRQQAWLTTTRNLCSNKDLAQPKREINE